MAALVDGLLVRPLSGLRFPPALEGQYRRDGEAERLRYQRRVGLSAVVIFGAFIITDATVVSDVFMLGVTLRCACMAVMLILLLLLRPGQPAWLTEGAIAAFCVPSCAVVGALFAFSHSPYRTAYMDSIIVIVTCSNICLQQRFRWALVANGLILAIDVAWLRFGNVPAEVQMLQIGMVLAAMGLTLQFSRRLEAQFRRHYLLTLQAQVHKQALQRSNDRLRELSERDGLTGLANRRAVDRLLLQGWTNCAARGLSLTVIMLDVDWFKRFNDRYGHPAGDGCLRAIGGAIGQQIRNPKDLAGRYGGEEFIIMIQGAELPAAHAMAERIRTAIEALRIPHDAAPGGGVVTASLGLASICPRHGGSVADLLQAADAALYRAKQDGRSRVTCAAEPARVPAVAGAAGGD